MYSHTHTLMHLNTTPFPPHTGRCFTPVTVTQWVSSQWHVTVGCTGFAASPSPTTAASSTGCISWSRVRSCTGSATQSEQREPGPGQGRRGTVRVTSLQLFFPEIRCSFSSKVWQTKTPFCIYSLQNCRSQPGLCSTTAATCGCTQVCPKVCEVCVFGVACWMVSSQVKTKCNRKCEKSRKICPCQDCYNLWTTKWVVCSDCCE